MAAVHTFHCIIGWPDNDVTFYDIVTKLKHFPRYWPFVRGMPGEFPSQMPVTRSFDVFFYLPVNKRLSKEPIRRWFETPSRSLWRHYNEWRHICRCGSATVVHAGGNKWAVPRSCPSRDCTLPRRTLYTLPLRTLYRLPRRPVICPRQHMVSCFQQIWYHMQPCMRTANERRRYIVTSSLIGWTHTQNDACIRMHRYTYMQHAYRGWRCNYVYIKYWQKGLS